MRCLQIIPVLAGLLFFGNSVNAQLAKKYNYTQHRYQSLRYGWYSPSNYDREKSYTLIVYLHGSRDTVSRDISWYQESVQKENPSFVLTPKCENPDQGWGNTWNAGHTTATTKTLALIDSLLKVYPIDPD